MNTENLQSRITQYNNLGQWTDSLRMWPPLG